MLMIAGVLFVLMSPSREGIVAAGIAVLALGVIMLGLMMGLMRRAARMCEDWPEAVLPAAETADNERPAGWLFRLLALANVVLLAAGLAGGVFYYYRQWDQAREEAWHSSGREDYGRLREQFYAHLLAGRIDEAYKSTTTDFRTRISRQQLAELAQRYVAYVNSPKTLGEGSGGSGPVAGDRSRLQSQSVTLYEYTRVEERKIVMVTLTIRFDRDSILLPEAPPLKVDDFKVEEKPASDAPWPGFGRKLGPGR